MIPVNTILQGDSIEVMKALPDASVDVVFADPPYFMQLSGRLHRPDATHVHGVDDAWDKFDDFAAYDCFTKAWLAEAKRVLKEDGTLWVIGSYHNIFRLGYHLQNMGFWILNDIVWVKINPMPNFKGKRFTNAHETLIWCSKNRESKYTFNYDSMKAFNEDLQMRSDWHLPICLGHERLRLPSGERVHATQKPESLLTRVILSSTKPGDIVLDPFFGTGTTGAVAKKLGRCYIGIEQNEDYVAYAEKRLAGVSEGRMALADPFARVSQTRPTFGMLLEAGLIHPGYRLWTKKKEHVATVMADGSLVCDKTRGSIHQVAAVVQQLSAANGWVSWYYEDQNGELTVLDTLRHLLKKQLLQEQDVSSIKKSSGVSKKRKK